MTKIRIETSMDPSGTKVFLDGEQLTGVCKVQYVLTANDEPMLTLEVYPSDLEISGPCNVDIVSRDFP